MVSAPKFPTAARRWPPADRRLDQAHLAGGTHHPHQVHLDLSVPDIGAAEPEVVVAVRGSIGNGPRRTVGQGLPRSGRHRSASSTTDLRGRYRRRPERPLIGARLRTAGTAGTAGRRLRRRSVPPVPVRHTPAREVHRRNRLPPGGAAAPARRLSEPTGRHTVPPMRTTSAVCAPAMSGCSRSPTRRWSRGAFR